MKRRWGRRDGGVEGGRDVWREVGERDGVRGVGTEERRDGGIDRARYEGAFIFSAPPPTPRTPPAPRGGHRAT